jgi:membrane-associated phospholipid phosphatase
VPWRPSVAALPREPRSKRIRGGFVLEAAAVVGIYVVYSWAGDAVIGAAPDAFRNAEQIIDWEERLGLYHERTVQEWFLPYRWFIGFWNLFYGSIHFGALVLALIALYHFDPGRYVLWRNVFLWMLPLALIGFWLYPLMPPRWLPSRFGFVDTRLTYVTIGKPIPHAEETGNVFAAMPSLHIAWSTLVVLALWPLMRPWWARILLASYPALMLFATVVTANHFFLDAVGGWGALLIGYALARGRDWWPSGRASAERHRPPSSAREAREPGGPRRARGPSA